MWQFIISGYIPGTDIQVTFENIALLSGGFILCIILGILIKREIKLHQTIKSLTTERNSFETIAL